MPFVAERPKQIGFVWISRPNPLSTAHPNHWSAPRLTRPLRRSWNVSEIFGFARIGHVNDRSPVGLHLAGQRIQRGPSVMSDISDKTIPLMMDDGLVRGPILQIIIADQGHIFSFSTASRGSPRSSRHLAASW